MHNKIRPFYRLLYLLAIFILPSNSFAQQQPIPDWVKDIGGSGESKVSGVAVDKFDNVYIAGNFRSTITVDLSGISAPVNLISNGDYDIFIAKYTPDGKLIWAKSIGGSELDQVNNLTVDDESNVIFGGQFTSSSMDSDPGSGTFNLNNAGGNDAFIVKLDLDGNFKWAKNVGSSSTEYGHVVAADRLGNIIFVGSFSSNISLGSFNLQSKGGLDGFMVKYDKNGNIQWAYGFGSFGTDEIRHVITNTNNEIIIMGYFSSNIDLNPKGPANNITGTSPNYFIAKYTGTGQLIWSDKIDGATAVVSSLASGPNNDIYLTGVYSGTVTLSSPTNNVALTSTGGKNLFVGKYSSSGAALWGKNIGGNSPTPYSYYITADVDDNVYIGGYFDGTLIFGDAALNKTLTYHGNRDTFFGKYTGSGDYVWAFNFGSSCSGNFGHKIAVDSKKNVLLGGSFCNTVDFNPGTCNLNITAKNFTSDGYISKYNQIKFTGDANIISFGLTEQSSPAIINTAEKKITIRVKSKTDVSKLIPTLTTDIGVLTPLSGVVTDFTQPKTYKISSNCVDYSWLVSVLVDDSRDISICSGEALTIVGKTENNELTAIYQWQVKDVDGNWIAAPNVNTSLNYDIQGINNNTNTIIILELRRKITLNNIDSFDSETVVNINPTTTNNIITTPQAIICEGVTNIAITGTTPDGAGNTALAYRWQQSDDGQTWLDIVNETAKDIASKEISKTQYFKRLTVANSCIASSNIIKIEFQQEVTPANAGNDILICNTNTTALAANSKALANEIGTWTVVSPTNYNPFDASNLNDPKAQINNIPTDVDVILKWTILQTICQTKSESTVKIHNYSTPVLSLASVVTINEGQSIQIPATISPFNTYTFLWSPGTGLDNPNNLTPLAKPDQTTIYHLKVTYGSNCMLERDLKIVVDKTTKIEICGGERRQLIGDQNNDSSPTFQWQTYIGGLWSDVIGENQENFSLATTEHFENSPKITPFRRKITVDGTIYFDSKYEITIFPSANNNIISIPESTFCSSGEASLSILGSQPGGSTNLNITFFWETSTDGINWAPLSNATNRDLMLSNISKTVYCRRATFNGKCISLSNVVKIQINPPATIANAGLDRKLCGDLLTTLNANAPAENEIGTWSVISPTTYSPFTTTNIHDPNATITNIPFNQPLILQWEIVNNNCNTKTSSPVEVISYRNLSVQSPSTLSIDFGKKVNLDITTDLTSDDQYTFDWSPKIGLSNANILSPDASPTENTLYTLKINYGFECVKYATVQVIVLNQINIPTSFSPNGDGVNDLWEIRNIANYPGSKISVFNRYGTVLFQTNTTYNSWDGTHNGKILPIGTYYYVISLKDKKNSVFNGSITILH